MPIEEALLDSLKWANELGSEAERSVARTISIGGHDVLVSRGVELKSLEPFQPAPYSIKETKVFIEVGGFAEYVNAFKKTPETLIFASLDQRKATAIIDYHGPLEPSWATHKAELVSQPTPEWKFIKEISGKSFSQIEFANMLLKWAHVVVEPDAATLSEAALNLEGSVGGTFQAKVTRANGSFVFLYQEDVVSNLRMPDHLLIRVPPFYNSQPIDCAMRLSYRIKEGTPTFSMELPNMERIEREALATTWAEVKEATGLSVLVGP